MVEFYELMGEGDVPADLQVIYASPCGTVEVYNKFECNMQVRSHDVNL